MLRKIPFETSAEILSRFDLSEEVAAVVTPDMAPAAVIEALDKASALTDLVNFIGHALPPREGICWALAVTSDLNPNLRGDVTNLVSEWVREPQEGTRQKLMKRMDEMNSDTPLYWLSAAVAWNGSGGIGAAEGPVVLPPAWLHAKALLGTIALQMGKDETEVDRARAVALVRGNEVANGGWPTVSETTG
jgi:hypothetical protein